MSLWRRMGQAVLRGIGRIATTLAWLGVPLFLGGIGSAVISFNQFYQIYTEEELAIVALGLVGGVWATVAGIALFIPWVRERVALSAMRSVWRPRQETWKQLYVAGYLRPQEYMPLAQSTELLLSRRQSAWVAWHALRVARGLALALLLAGGAGFLLARDSALTSHCHTESCNAVLVTMVSTGALIFVLGAGVFLLGVIFGTAARHQVGHALRRLAETETSLMTTANARNVDALPRQPSRRRKAAAQTNPT